MLNISCLFEYASKGSKEQSGKFLNKDSVSMDRSDTIPKKT